MVYKLLLQGREKMPAYWLGAFFYPRGLLALLKQECYRHHGHDRTGNIEPFVFQTEITARDKDHVSWTALNACDEQMILLRSYANRIDLLYLDTKQWMEYSLFLVQIN